MGRLSGGRKATSPPPLGGDALKRDALPVSSRSGEDLPLLKGARVTNLSGSELWRVKQMLPRGLRAREVVFLPDICPSRGLLPTGCVVHSEATDWPRFAVSDCGCGMQMIKSPLSANQFRSSLPLWDAVGRALSARKGGLGDLGGGNHFLDALLPYDEKDTVHFLIHTGSRAESGLVDGLVDDRSAFKREFERIVRWARSNRDTVTDVISKVYKTDLELVLDLPHNTYEEKSDGSVIIRKGAVHVTPGQRTILPSHMNGDVALLKAGSGVSETLFSLSHGTGRALPRGAAKEAALDAAELRRSIYIPSYIADSSLRGDAPAAYRPLDLALGLLGEHVEELARFKVIAYLGHL